MKEDYPKLTATMSKRSDKVAERSQSEPSVGEEDTSGYQEKYSESRKA
jgi:hypothetical protein